MRIRLALTLDIDRRRTDPADRESTTEATAELAEPSPIGFVAEPGRLHQHGQASS